MKSTLRQTAVAIALGLGLATSWAQDFKIGFVNTDRIFRESNPAKDAQAKLEREFSKREKELDDQGAQLKTAGDKFEREGPTLSETQRTTRQRQLMEQDRDYRRRRTEFQEDLAQRKNEELQQVIERANKVIKQVAENEKYDLILQEAVYISPKHDITDKVLKVINTAK
ncbi:MAG TPA: OmpH family outer membrane protein [Burkholderiaceae bacterium]|nr:OmpH family outer membrane protein [Burkholderiaceae bacterium]